MSEDLHKACDEYAGKIEIVGLLIGLVIGVGSTLILVIMWKGPL